MLTSETKPPHPLIARDLLCELTACIGCIRPNKIPKMTTVAFGAITVTGNVSVYAHIMDINTTVPHLLNKSQKMGWGGGGGGGLSCSFLR